ncbi:uncharacterized protein LOC128249941 isoform X1 [Octopus bimaculoides]|uniref:uncharacterized protein LOC128249941 isoform X1 n=1 Tax=Octopus bimaculoides TaxID=37653 RepID=UPI0022E6B798|nr:uncharacterized protein LOC128249941 isoform X1 [Octopus bimaculoides]
MIRILILIAILISHAATSEFTWKECQGLGKQRCYYQYSQYISSRRDCGGYKDFLKCFTPNVERSCHSRFKRNHWCYHATNNSRNNKMASPISTILTALLVILFKKNQINKLLQYKFDVLILYFF